MAKYRLELVKLYCDRRQDTVGRDEPKIVVEDHDRAGRKIRGEKLVQLRRQRARRRVGR